MSDWYQQHIQSSHGCSFAIVLLQHNAHNSQIVYSKYFVHVRK